MDSSEDTSLHRRLGRLVGRTVLTAAAVAVSLYATRRRPAPEESHKTLASEPAEGTVETADEVTDEEATAEEVPTEDEAQEPSEGEADQSVREAAAEEPAGGQATANDESDELEEPADEATTLEELTADELYPVAQGLGITGRATMDQAQLVEALQAEGIHDVADMESVEEETPAQEEADESADGTRPLTELTADELYPVAQQLDIPGRATMDQEELLEALQAEGVQEIVDGEPVGEQVAAEDESEASVDEASALEDLTADELYPAAQQLGITGRATMDQEQLVEALQAEGVHDVADGEPVVEVADTGDTTSTEEPAAEHNTVKPLDELTASELYRVAQRLDIAGRSTMRKAELVEALQAEGIDEAEV